MHNKVRFVGGDFLSEKKEHVVGHEHFWGWSSEIVFFIIIFSIAEFSEALLFHFPHKYLVL